MATNKLLNKESLNGVFAEIKRELGNIPQSVTDLEDASDYATKEDAQAMVDEAKVTGASVDYQEDGGSPSATVNFSEGSLDFTLKNMKMKFSELTNDEKEELRGPQGIPGEGAIWTGSGEEIMTLAQETGQAINKAMSQKAVTDELLNINYKFGEAEEVSSSLFLNGHFNNVAYGSTVSSTRASNTNFKSAEIPCQEGDVLAITCSYNTSNGRAYFFIDENRKVLKCSNQYTGTYTEEPETAPAGTAYLIVNCSSSSTRKVTIKHAVNVANDRSSLSTLYNFTAYENIVLNETLGGIFNVPPVGSTIDLENNVIDAADNSRSIIECKEGDIFFIRTRSAKIANATAFAVLDGENKVLIKSRKSASISSVVAYSYFRVIIPSGGAKLIVNSQLDYDHGVRKSDEASVNHKAITSQNDYGFHRIHHFNTTSTTATKYIYGDSLVPFFPTRNGKCKIVVRKTSSYFHLRAVKDDGTYADYSITSGEASYSNSKFIGFSIILELSGTAIDVELDMDLYTNDAYDNKYGEITKKMDKPTLSSSGNIPIFDENGNVTDSGYNIGNLPSGESDFPEGGNDGEVLKTDGEGNYYWGSVPTQIETDAGQPYGVLVDAYEELNTGTSSVPSIKAAIEAAGIGGTIIFTPNKTYNIDSQITLKRDMVVIGNGATIKRMNKSQAILQSARSSQNVLPLDAIPSDWKVGDKLWAHTGTAQSTAKECGTITEIDTANNTVKVSTWITIDEGAKVTKSVPMFASAQSPVPSPVKIYNLVFDGNKDNNSDLLHWHIHGTVSVYGYGTIISGCKFINIPTENIITHGAVVENCYAENLNGSFVHLSCPKAASLTSGEKYMGTSIVNNIVKGSNCVDPSLTGHSAAVIEQSWNAGKTIVSNNQFFSGGYGVCFNFANIVIPGTESDAATDQNAFMIITDNIFKGYTAISPALYAPSSRNCDRKIMTDNMFVDCGTTDFANLYLLNIRFENNLLHGETVVNTGGNSLMYRIDTAISSTPTASQLTTKYASLPAGGQVYVTQLGKQYRKIMTNNSTIIWVEENVTILSE